MSYVLGDDVLAQSSSSTAQYLLYDGHGSTRQLSQVGNKVIEQYNYDAYGQTTGGALYTTASPPATKLMYAGEQFDTSIQQYYLRARYYDQSNGRFNQLDTYAGNTADPQSLHKYLYAAGDPIRKIDPNGHEATTIETTAAGGGYSILAGIQLPAISGAFTTSLLKIGVIELQYQRL